MENSRKKNLYHYLFSPGVVISMIILLGIFTLFLTQNRSNTLARTSEVQIGTVQQTNNKLSSTTVTSKNQTPIFDITKRPAGPSTSSEVDYLKWMLSNTSEKQAYLVSKWQMAQTIIKNQDASDPRVLEAFLRTPREFFFSPGNAVKAYASIAVSIGYGQTISGPQLVARMTQTINPQPGQKVLEVGTGSGYQSAVLSELSNYVYTIEIVPQLAKRTDALYTRLTKSYPEYANIKRKNADGYYGWAEYAPFDRIIVTAGIDHVPPDLLAQLAPGGIMVIPVGPPSGQTILKITKEILPDGSVTFVREDIYHGKKVIFVPFTAGQGIHSNTSNQ